MRSILALSAVLVVLLLIIGPERGPLPLDQACSVRIPEEVCLDRGRLIVSARGFEGRLLADAVVAFSRPGESEPAVVVRVESATLNSDSATSGEALGARVRTGVSSAAESGELFDRVFIASLTREELWVELTDPELERTRIYHRPAGEGWGLVDVVPRVRSQRLAELHER